LINHPPVKSGKLNCKAGIEYLVEAPLHLSNLIKLVLKKREESKTIRRKGMSLAVSYLQFDVLCVHCAMEAMVRK